jgi:hypothetical protein
MKTTTPTPARTASELDTEVLRPIDPWRMARFLQSRAIDLAIAQAQRTVDLSLQSACFAHDTDLGTVASDLTQRADTDAARLLASLLGIKFTLDQCPELPAIEKEIGPAFDEWQARRVAEAEAARLAGIAENARRAAMEESKRQALAEVEARFAVS